MYMLTRSTVSRNHLLMDDANVPSLLSLPYICDVDVDDPVYRNTRRMVWSDSNPYFFSGKAGEGIGGPQCGLWNDMADEYHDEGFYFAR